MLRLDAPVAAIAERAISSYDYVHAAISTYPAFFCMNFDVRTTIAFDLILCPQFPWNYKKYLKCNCYFLFQYFLSISCL